MQAISCFEIQSKYKQRVKVFSDTTQQTVLEEIYYPTHQIVFFVTSIQFIACALRENLSNRSSGVQASHDICTRFRRYLYSTKYSGILKLPRRL